MASIDQALIRRRTEELAPARKMAYKILERSPYMTRDELRSELAKHGFEINTAVAKNWADIGQRRWGGGTKRETTPLKERHIDPIEFLRQHPEQSTDLGLIIVSAMLVTNDELRQQIKELKEQVQSYIDQEEGWKVDRQDLFLQFNECQERLKRLTGSWEIDPNTHKLVPKKR